MEEVEIDQFLLLKVEQVVVLVVEVELVTAQDQAIHLQ